MLTGVVGSMSDVHVLLRVLNRHILCISEVRYCPSDPAFSEFNKILDMKIECDSLQHQSRSLKASYPAQSFMAVPAV